jgi:hypothetical protein
MFSHPSPDTNKANDNKVIVQPESALVMQFCKESKSNHNCRYRSHNNSQDFKVHVLIPDGKVTGYRSDIQGCCFTQSQSSYFMPSKPALNLLNGGDIVTHIKPREADNYFEHSLQLASRAWGPRRGILRLCRTWNSTPVLRDSSPRINQLAAPLTSGRYRDSE